MVIFTLFNPFISFRCQDNYMTIYPADVVLFEGILVFYFPAIRDLFHMKLFVDTDSDTRLSRRGKILSCFLIFIYHQFFFRLFRSLTIFIFITVVRDITERGRDLETVLTQYMTFVKPAFEEFCSPVSTPDKRIKTFFHIHSYKFCCFYCFRPKNSQTS